MINDKLINPSSIVVVGGSEDLLKPGGKILKNIIDGGYSGDLFAVNPKQDCIQGVKSYRDIRDIPSCRSCNTGNTFKIVLTRLLIFL